MSSLTDLDLSTFTEIQKQLHLGKPEEPITSPLFRVWRKITWNSHVPVKMKGTVSDDTITFECPPNFHALLYSSRIQHLPSIRVKDPLKHRICWCYNIGFNTIVEGRAIIDKESRQHFDNVFMDCDYQFFSDPGEEDDVKEDIGNVPELIEWQTLLPEYYIDVQDPWFYNQNKEFSCRVPLYLKTIEHEYVMRNNIADLLRVQEWDGEKWVSIKCDLDLVEIAQSDKKKLRPPELWGRFDKMDKDELAWSREFFKKDDAHIHDFPEGTYTIWYQDMIKCESKNPFPLGKQITTDMTSDAPVRALFVVAQNLKSVEFNNRSNYSVDPEDVAGRPPIDTLTYKYSISPRFEKIPWRRLSRTEPRNHAKRRPLLPSYGMYSHSFNPKSLDADIGIVYDTRATSLKASIMADLKDNNPYDKFGPNGGNGSKIDTGNEFHLCVRLLVTRKMTFECTKTTEPYEYRIIPS